MRKRQVVCDVVVPRLDHEMEVGVQVGPLQMGKPFLKIFLVADRHNIFIFIYLFFYAVLRIKPRVSHVLGKHSTAEP